MSIDLSMRGLCSKRSIALFSQDRKLLLFQRMNPALLSITPVETSFSKRKQIRPKGLNLTILKPLNDEKLTKLTIL